MSQKIATTCDQCEKTKSPAGNHWHRVGVYYDAIEWGVPEEARPLRLELGTLREPGPGEHRETADLCGDGCLQKYVMNLMGRVDIRPRN